MMRVDMLDIHRVLILFRSDIRFRFLPQICEALTVYYQDRRNQVIEHNCVREVVRSQINFDSLNEEEYLKWEFVRIEPCKMDSNRMDFETDSLFSFVFDRIYDLLFAHKYDQAYDFVDSVHCLPEIIVNAGYVSSTYVAVYMGNYVSKWKDEEVLRFIQVDLHNTVDGSLC